MINDRSGQEVAGLGRTGARPGWGGVWGGQAQHVSPKRVEKLALWVPRRMEGTWALPSGGGDGTNTSTAIQLLLRTPRAYTEGAQGS